MPKYILKSTGWLGWFILAIFIGFVSWIIISGFRDNPLAATIGLAAALLYGFAVTRYNHLRIRRLRTLVTEREGESICDFARSFNAHEVDTWVIRAVYEQLQQYLTSVAPHFPVRPEDRLLGQLIDDPDDLDLDLVYEIASRTGRTLEDVEKNAYYSQVHTVRDLVFFFNSQPTKNAT